MKKITIIAMAVALISACKKEEKRLSSDSAVQLDLSSGPSNQTTRDLELHFYTTQDTNSSIPPTACSGDLPGFANPGYFLHGTASHIGQINPSGSRGQDVTCNLSFATALLTTTISGQIEAANGDLIYYTGADEIDVYGLLTQTSGTGSITGEWTITGGTGRFEDATGSFTISGPVDYASGTFSFDGEGTITY